MKMLSGAREGAAGGLRGLLARAMARDLCAFVVPGADVARARGLDLAAAGLHRADTPRHANVLLIAGPLPPALVDAACVVWAQMPRPRAILALEAGDIAPLPDPDAVGALSQAGLEAGLADLRRAFVTGAFAHHVIDFEAPALTARIEYTCPMHPEVVSDQSGKCPKCGMFLVEREVSGTAPASHEGHEGHEGHEKSPEHPAQAKRTGHSTHATHASEKSATYTCPMHPEITSDGPGSCPKCGMILVPQGETGDQVHSGHGGHAGHSGPDAHGGHNGHNGQGGHGGHGGHGAAPDIPGIEPHFMSMVGLTEGKPASPGGLIMEWIDAPFGPFFPGLPGGLGLMLTLDGDSVARAGASSLASAPPAPGFAAKELPDRLAALSPLTPDAMRELACRALEAATGTTPEPAAATARAAAMERERVASHLGWLAGLARQTGLSWLERRAAALHHGLCLADADEIARRAPAIHAIAHRVGRAPLLRDKLANIGRIAPPEAEGIGGPVARASGMETDARADEPAYAAFGFGILTQTGGDARARLSQRLAEIGQSLDLIARAGAIALPGAPTTQPQDGHGLASVETPRGKATLHLNLKGGSVETLHLTTPFAKLAGLVAPMTEQMELAEALSAIGSLDLDPWGAGA